MYRPQYKTQGHNAIHAITKNPNRQDWLDSLNNRISVLSTEQYTSNNDTHRRTIALRLTILSITIIICAKQSVFAITKFKGIPMYLGKQA